VLLLIRRGDNLLRQGGQLEPGGHDPAADLVATLARQLRRLAVESGLRGDLDPVVADLGHARDRFLQRHALHAVRADAQRAAVSCLSRGPSAPG
jgi:hypothetical protein